MATLTIDFQEGFAEETVVLRVCEREVFRQEHVSTKLVVGLAGTFTTTVKDGRISVDVVIPTRGLKKAIPLDVSGETFIGISIVNNAIEHVALDHPFAYS